jgi:hypothetical protein
MTGVNVEDHQPGLYAGTYAHIGPGPVNLPPEADGVYICGGVEVSMLREWVLADIWAVRPVAGTPPLYGYMDGEDAPPALGTQASNP